MAEYATKGVSNTALGLSIGALAGELLSGNLGNILGGGGINAPVSRYESDLLMQNAELKADVKFRDANTYTDQKLLEMYRYFDGKLGCVERELCDQKVYNATNTATLSCISGQIAQLMSLTKTIVPASSVCPEPMPALNSWVAPTTT